MTARIRSFFMGEDGNRFDRVALPTRTPLGQTVSRSRAPVSDEGCRNLDMALASI
jgi:hypothetical protein